ncbi:MAG TPA: PEGA domain-containing protein [Verrucomicrobiae bacterium]|nr:PEGA domain-containing protein [Verrucomicrobiae bacterium]
MDYLDPQKELRHRIILLVGYVLIAIAITIGTLILVYEAYGFGLGKNGNVIQNGLLFFSSQPHPANIYVNGILAKSQTNTRLVLPENIYHVTLTRSGYRPWQRTIELLGGTVEHFDYPFLIPAKLTTKKEQPYNGAPGLMTQSPDRRWLLVQTPGSMTSFEMYDLTTSPLKTPATFSLPSGILTKATTNEKWQLDEWADDNRHVLLEHDYDGKSEFILVDRTNPDQSLNLNTTLATNPPELKLVNKKYDQYYLYTPTTGDLQTATLASTKVAPALQHVLAFQSYGSDTILYVTNNGASPGKVLIKLQSGGQTYTLHSLPAGTNYLVDLTKYSGTLYVAVGAGSENKVYIYQDPIGQLAAQPKQALVPAQVLRVNNPNYVSFSTNAQFIVAESGTHFGVYDIENQKGYQFTTNLPLDTPQIHASWMDGDRLNYVSGGKLVMLDYDNNNRQTLTTASSNYVPAFPPNYHFVYAVAPSAATGQFELDQTALLTLTDQ